MAKKSSVHRIQTFNKIYLQNEGKKFKYNLSVWIYFDLKEKNLTYVQEMSS